MKSLPMLPNLHKVLVLGSGPILIGQAAEFDYAGTQACKALKECGIHVVLVNSNPATIMTDPDVADTVYLEPLTVESVASIIRKEKPDGLLATLGGQTALNLAMDLERAGVFQDHGVRLLGTQLSSIEQAEDRELFKQKMEAIGQPVPESAIASTVDEALQIAEEHTGFPCIVRPAFTLGGTGGGVAHDPEELKEIAGRGLRQSPINQVLVERSLLGWKEIEYEILRDAYDTCITICNMENVDPVGIHTGDSIVVAPSQTLTDVEYQMLRDASIEIVRALEVVGGCNVQLALHPESKQYYVIEVNPRVSRSSALASKATGYPIAKIASLVAVGFRLDELRNPVTGVTYASFEPALDYMVVKIPRWPFDKFATSNRSLGTQMKATGETMSIDRSFEGALQKAVRSLDSDLNSLFTDQFSHWSDDDLASYIAQPDDRRLFLLMEAFKRGQSVEELQRLTGIDPWFLHKLASLNQIYHELQGKRLQDLDQETWLMLKTKGFSDRDIARALGVSMEECTSARQAVQVRPAYHLVDTCAGEFPAVTPYFYSSYRGSNEVVSQQEKPKALILGSGPIRIGQGIEFDYCSVRALWALRKLGWETIMINNNPETVSTDFDTADRLYFEPLTPEDVMEIIRQEKVDLVFTQFGGQTALNLAAPLADQGVPLAGTSLQAIDTTEDRERCRQLLDRLHVNQAPGGSGTSEEEAVAIAHRIGFPVVVRPSYVIGGRAMAIVSNEEELRRYMREAVRVSPAHPVLVDRYLNGMEFEVDAVSDGRDVLIPGIMEHVEPAGVHSGDSLAIYPSNHLPVSLREEMVRVTRLLCRELPVIGLVNIQFVVADNRLYVLEINPRASRTIPIISKATGVPMVELGIQVQLGRPLSELGFGSGLRPPSSLPSGGRLTVAKAPVFSFGKLNRLDLTLGPEMKSTGEVLGVGLNKIEALAKAFRATGIDGSLQGVLCSFPPTHQSAMLPLIKRLAESGCRLYATPGTADFLAQAGLTVVKVERDAAAIAQLMQTGTIQAVLNIPSPGNDPERFGFRLRRMASEFRLPCLTHPSTIEAFLLSFLETRHQPLESVAINQLVQIARGGS